MATDDKEKEAKRPSKGDPSFQYEKLSAPDRLNSVVGRLTNLERSHYEERLNLMLADGEAATPIVERADQLESQILELRAEEDQLQAQVPEPPAS
jgi:hypothetical protein